MAENQQYNNATYLTVIYQFFVIFVTMEHLRKVVMMNMFSLVNIKNQWLAIKTCSKPAHSLFAKNVIKHIKIPQDYGDIKKNVFKKMKTIK